MQPETAPAASIAAETANEKVPVKTITRLSHEVYLKFEKTLPGPVIDRAAQDAGCDAAFKLGVQFVLQRLRAELVVE